MPRENYPLNALRAFEAAARRRGFVPAADELNVTAAAVSHQVKKLEAFLGVSLFRRQPRGLRLTDDGQRLVSDLTDIFLRLDRVVERMRETGARRTLTVSVAPMFAVKWLLPRLQRFDARHPDIDVRMSSSLSPIDFRRESFDAAIRLGHGNYPGLRADRLFAETVTPMCAPRLLDDGRSLQSPDDLRHHVLLHDDSMAFDPDAPVWETWLAAARASRVDGTRGPRFSQPDHALQAAIDGAGVVLGWSYLARDDLAAGRLVAPFDLQLPLGSAFYLVCPEADADTPNVTAFREWLTGEVGGSTPARLKPV